MLSSSGCSVSIALAHDEMVAALEQRSPTKHKPGRSSKLSLEDQILVTLQ
jgi:hypothetical protein